MSVEDPLTQEELHCTQSPILKNVTLRGGIKAGNFSDLGDEKNMHMCIALCCERKTCDLAFMIGGTCIAVDCFSEELCQAVKARPTIYDPQIAFIRRRELQRPNPTPNPSLSRKGRYYATFSRYRKNFRPAEKFDRTRTRLNLTLLSGFTICLCTVRFFSKSNIRLSA